MDDRVKALVLDDLRRRDRTRGLVIVGVAFVACLLASAWVRRASRPELSVPPAPPTTVSVVGFPKSVDAVKTLAAARALTRRSMLRGIVMDGVHSDGSVDVSESAGRISYAFQSSAGQGPQPAREPGTLARRWYCGRQSVFVRKEGMAAEVDNAEASCPVHPVDPLPEPRCTPGAVWKRALEHGAPAERLARIEYYRASAGPAWRFDQTGSKVRFSLYGDCARELTPQEAAVVSPY
ncbi:MAG TPA: hypothetical protein VGM29_07180 [Polyangiaceae bacterium]|jgi:hypothetical protein